MTDPPAAPPPNAGDNHDSTPAVKRDHDRPPPAEPNTTANNGRNHDYPWMIIDAIRAMNERGGSNRRTIGKFMEDSFSAQLPSSIDSDLLTHYLQAMKNSGHLLTANKSYYMLSPSSDSLPTFPPPPGGDGGSASGVKRSRVRPLKNNPDNGSDGHSVPLVTGPSSLPQDWSTSGLKRGRGRPPKLKLQGDQIEDRVKRRRGRPRKDKSCDGSSLPHRPSAPEVIGQSGRKRGRRRPRKDPTSQARIKKIVDEVKPYVNNKSALKALQELEELARTITSAQDERVRRSLRPRRETRCFKP